MHENSMKLMTYFRDKWASKVQGGLVLDIGSLKVGSQSTYRELFTNYVYTGMDIVEGPNVDIVGYAMLEQYDIVISGQTMEHIARPWEWMRKIQQYFEYYICIIAPNTLHEHRYPIDCYRFYPDGMRALFEYANILPLEIRKEGPDTIGIGEHGS